ncbi:high light inducible protein [bacterium]|nr:high light inducible protein [bacterium]
MSITTEDGNRQNMFAVEPKMYITEKDMTQHEEQTYAERAEKLNGRAAMLGFVSAVVSYLVTGKLFFGVF